MAHYCQNNLSAHTQMNACLVLATWIIAKNSVYNSKKKNNEFEHFLAS